MSRVDQRYGSDVPPVLPEWGAVTPRVRAVTSLGLGPDGDPLHGHKGSRHVPFGTLAAVNTGITIVVVFLVIVFVLAFPTRRKIERAFAPVEGPHPLLRPFLALARWRRTRRRRRHLSVHRD